MPPISQKSQSLIFKKSAAHVVKFVSLNIFATLQENIIENNKQMVVDIAHCTSY